MKFLCVGSLNNLVIETRDSPAIHPSDEVSIKVKAIKNKALQVIAG